MAMTTTATSLISLISSSFAISLIIAFLFLVCPSYCFNRPPDAFRGLMMEEKTRLGSTPPSCHNKCNECHPCMAVQVPTMPTPHNNNNNNQVVLQPTTSDNNNNRYSNYKPLGWKCRCAGHFYNP